MRALGMRSYNSIYHPSDELVQYYTSKQEAELKSIKPRNFFILTTLAISLFFLAISQVRIGQEAIALNLAVVSPEQEYVNRAQVIQAASNAFLPQQAGGQPQSGLGTNALIKKSFEPQFISPEISFPYPEKPLGEKSLQKNGLEPSEPAFSSPDIALPDSETTIGEKVLLKQGLEPAEDSLAASSRDLGEPEGRNVPVESGDKDRPKQAALDQSETTGKAAMRKFSEIVHSYLPASDYEDPCDAARIECCTDPDFPVLGGLDLVNYRLTGTISFGDPKHSTEITGIGGRSYKFWFTDKSLVPAFQASPESYIPKWGGFDAEQFCTDGDLSSLFINTVELSNLVEVGRRAAFNYVQNVESCDEKFNSFYGKPSIGVMNTRCISMHQFETAVQGLLSAMPETAIPVKISEQYQISHLASVGVRTSSNNMNASGSEKDTTTSAAPTFVKEQPGAVVLPVIPFFQEQAATSTGIESPRSEYISAGFTPQKVHQSPSNPSAARSLPDKPQASVFPPAFSSQLVVPPSHAHVSPEAMHALSNAHIQAFSLPRGDMFPSSEKMRVPESSSEFSTPQSSSYSTPEQRTVSPVFQGAKTAEQEIQKYFPPEASPVSSYESNPSEQLHPVTSSVSPQPLVQPIASPMTNENLLPQPLGSLTFDQVQVPKSMPEFPPLITPPPPPPRSVSPEPHSSEQIPQNVVSEVSNFQEPLSPNRLETSAIDTLYGKKGFEPQLISPDKLIGEKGLERKGLEPAHPDQLIGEKGLEKRGIEPAEHEFVSPAISFPNSEKPVGEKALMKRGLEDPSEFTPGIIKELEFLQDAYSPAVVIQTE